MAGQTDLERLVVTLEAKVTGFDKALRDVASNVNKQLTYVETRTNTMTARIEAAFARLGPRLTSTGKVIFGGALVYGIERFVESIIGAVSKIQDTADAIGVSTNALQEWSILAAKAGVKQDDFTAAIDRFANSLGTAQTKGGPLKQLFRELDVDINGGTEKAFLQFADAVAALTVQEQKDYAVRTLMGRTSIQLTSFLEQGSVAINKQGDELKRTGSIISDVVVKAIDNLGDKWTAVRATLVATGAGVIGGFAEEFSNLADQINSPEFQSNIKSFGKVLAEVAVDLAKAAKYAPEIAGAFAGAKFGRLFGGAPGALAGAALGVVAGRAAFPDTSLTGQLDTAKEVVKQIELAQGFIARLSGQAEKNPLLIEARLHVEELEKQIANEKNKIEEQKPVEVKARVVIDDKAIDDILVKLKDAELELTKVLAQPGVHLQEQIDEKRVQIANLTSQLAYATASQAPPKPTKVLNLQFEDEAANASILKRTVIAAAAAERDRIRAVDEANAKILEGTTSTYDAIRKRIADDTVGEIAAIREREQAEVDAQIAVLKDKQDKSTATKLDEQTNTNAIINIHKEATSLIAKIEAEGRSKRLDNLRAEKEEQFKLAEELIELSRTLVSVRTAALVEITQGTRAFYEAERRQIQVDLDNKNKTLDEELQHRIDNLNEIKRIEEAANGPGAYKNFDKDVADAQQKFERQRQINNEESHTQIISSNLAEKDDAFRTQEDILQQRRSTAASETALRLELAQGTEEMYALEREQANQQAEDQKARIREELEFRLADLSKREEEAHGEADLVARLEQEKADARIKANDQIKESENSRLIEQARIFEEETRLKARASEINDALRNGLEDLGIAAIDGSKDFGQAVQDMIKQLALLSIRLFILKPLIEGAFGTPGTAGGGLLGKLLGIGSAIPGAGGAGTTSSLFSSLGGEAASAFGAAKGAVIGPRGSIPLRRYGYGGVARSGSPQMAVFGEGSMNEAFVPLPDGRRIPVDLRIPPMKAGSAGWPSNLTIRSEINLAGANGDETIRRIAGQAAIQGTQAAIATIKKNFASMTLKANRDEL